MNDELIERRTPRSLGENLLFKVDRTVAIAGIIIMGVWALTLKTPESVNIAMAAIGGLVGYVGGRTGK